MLWDALTGWHGWALDYFIPCTCMVAIFALGVTGKVMRLPPGDYLGCILADAVFGVVPLVFYLTDLLRFPYLSLTWRRCQPHRHAVHLYPRRGGKSARSLPAGFWYGKFLK